MKKREVVEYVAFDGKVFKNEFECKAYENNHMLREFAEQKLEEVASKLKEILRSNDMHLEVTEGYCGIDRILICFDEHFADLKIEL